jgi:hypothetical protein
MMRPLVDRAVLLAGTGVVGAGAYALYSLVTEEHPVVALALARANADPALTRAVGAGPLRRPLWPLWEGRIEPGRASVRVPFVAHASGATGTLRALAVNDGREAPPEGWSLIACEAYVTSRGAAASGDAGSASAAAGAFGPGVVAAFDLLAGRELTAADVSDRKQPTLSHAAAASSSSAV